MEKEAIQESEYIYPYHYIPHIKNDIPCLTRHLSWGWEYLSYQCQLVKELEKVEYDSLIDVGCGDGFFINSFLSSKLSSKEVRGIDFSDKAISFARAFCSKKDVFISGDVSELNEIFDVVTLVEVIEHISDTDLPLFLKSINKLSTKYIFITVPTTAFPLQSKHYRHYDENLLSQQVKDYLEDFEIDFMYRVYSNSKFLKFVKRIMMNRIFTINSKLINSIVWKMIQKFFLFDSVNGMHLIVKLNRVK